MRPDARQLAALAGLLGEGRLSLRVAAVVGLAEAPRALEWVTAASVPGAVVIRPRC